jgi:phosphatidyl-N-methylethanolamine N-methyltransferase
MTLPELVVCLCAAALLAVERVCYAWVWQRPDSFRQICRRFASHSALRGPIETLQALFYGFKLLQAAVFIGWGCFFGALSGWPNNWREPAGCAGLALVAVGQMLNVSVFLRLGRSGVFYGNRFGRETVWREGFPFSWLDHPQYVGASLSIWGLFLLLRHPHQDWLILPLLETVYYGIGAHLERLPAPAAAADRR